MKLNFPPFFFGVLFVSQKVREIQFTVTFKISYILCALI